MIYWGTFVSIITFLMIVDLRCFLNKDHVIGYRDSLILTLFYFTAGVSFGLLMYFGLIVGNAEEYFTGFIIEKAMAIDNVFVISIVFKFYAVPPKFQHKVLFWGILGVIIMRALMIGGGVALINNFSWILYFAAAILIYTGVKALYISEETKYDVKQTFIYKALNRIFHIYPKIENNKFFIRKDKKLMITPLFMALITIEFVDVIFAVDSLPAIFAITQDPYVIYTSNIFAILGLRALFFCVEGVISQFHYIKYSLALILIFIGVKIFIHNFLVIPPYVSLLVTSGILSVGGIISFLYPKKNNNAH